MRPQDQRGISMFEPPKTDGVPYAGFKLDWGAAFTQQMQALDHSNAAAPRLVNGVDANRLIEIGPGFNNAAANLFLNAQLAPGIRVALTTWSWPYKMPSTLRCSFQPRLARSARARSKRRMPSRKLAPMPTDNRDARSAMS